MFKSRVTKIPFVLCYAHKSICPSKAKHSHDSAPTSMKTRITEPAAFNFLLCESPAILDWPRFEVNSVCCAGVWG